MLKQQLVILITGFLSTIPLTSYSCALHGDFGFDRFPRLHPLAQQHNTDQFAQTLLLKHITKTQVLSGEETAVIISYRAPINYDKVNVSFSGSQHIEFLESSTVTLQQISSSDHLRYSVSRPSTYQVSIQIDAIDAVKAISTLQHIVVRSSLTIKST